jgi:hypothetical protein
MSGTAGIFMSANILVKSSVTVRACSIAFAIGEVGIVFSLGMIRSWCFASNVREPRPVRRKNGFTGHASFRRVRPRRQP